MRPPSSNRCWRAASTRVAKRCKEDAMRNPARDCVYCQEQAAKEVQRPFGKERELRGRERESRESKANSTMRGGNRDPFLSRREAAAVTVAGSVRQEQTGNVDDAGHAGVGTAPR